MLRFSIKAFVSRQKPVYDRMRRMGCMAEWKHVWLFTITRLLILLTEMTAQINPNKKTTSSGPYSLTFQA